MYKTLSPHRARAHTHKHTRTHKHTHTPAPTGGVVTVPEDTLACQVGFRI